MKSYYRIMLGKKSAYAEECFAGNFIGTDFNVGQDLTGKLPEEWRVFNKQFIPAFLALHPDKSRIAAGLACGFLWTVSKGIKNGDVVLCPDGSGRYRVGEIKGDYFYQPDGVLPHRRPVIWHSQIDRADMSVALKNSTGSIGTVSNITGYRDEIEKFTVGVPVPTLLSTDETVEDPAAFAMEKHLEDFLVQNWAQTDLGREYDIYEEDGERVGQQLMRTGLPTGLEPRQAINAYSLTASLHRAIRRGQQPPSRRIGTPCGERQRSLAACTTFDTLP